MKIDVSNYEMERHFKKLNAMIQSDKPLPAAAAYGIVRALNTMQDALSPFSMVRDQLIRRYSGGGTALNRDENPEAFDACIKELDEIGNKHIQIEVPQIVLADLRDAKFTLAEMDALQLLIVERTADDGKVSD